MEPIVTTTAGRVRGRVTDGVLSFKGIPYAAPPFGHLRFAAPEPPRPWSGVLDCLEFGPTAPKPGYPAPFDQLLPEPEIAGEDALNLNVWTPATEGARPVFVWIHGGAFVHGSGAVSTYDGTAFARDGIVCVTLNYRLGVDGFLLLDGAPANRGLLDQVAALRWIHANIAAFGGDPDNVTIAGESAGAMSVCTLMSMPQADGLYRRAIAQSGGADKVISRPTAAKVTAALAESLGIAPTADAFAEVPVPTLTAAQAALSARILAEPNPLLWGEIVGNGMAYEPCIDGEVLTAMPIERIAAGAGTATEVLIGTNDNEYTFFLVPTGVHAFLTEDAMHAMLAGYGRDVETATGAYRAANPDGSPGQLFMDALRDEFFRVPAVRVAEARHAHGTTTHVYEFGWRSTQFGGALGATHALEMPFVFDTLADPSVKALAGDNPPQALADEMHRAWVAFAATGDPGWAPYGAERTVRRFGGTDEGVVRDPHPALRAVWDGAV